MKSIRALCFVAVIFAASNLSNIQAAQEQGLIARSLGGLARTSNAVVNACTPPTRGVTVRVGKRMGTVLFEFDRARERLYRRYIPATCVIGAVGGTLSALLGIGVMAALRHAAPNLAVDVSPCRTIVYGVGFGLWQALATLVAQSSDLYYLLSNRELFHSVAHVPFARNFSSNAEANPDTPAQDVTCARNLDLVFTYRVPVAGNAAGVGDMGIGLIYGGTRHVAVARTFEERATVG